MVPELSVNSTGLPSALHAPEVFPIFKTDQPHQMQKVYSDCLLLPVTKLVFHFRSIAITDFRGGTVILCQRPGAPDCLGIVADD